MNTKLNYQFWIAIIGICIALIGAIPQIITWINPTNIKGKIISNYGSYIKIPGNELEQIAYVQKLSIFSKNNDYQLRDIKVFLKYPSKKNELQATIWTWRTNGLSMTFNENGKNINKTLIVDPSEYLIHFTILPKNSTVVGYISYSVNYQIDEMFEYVRYEFIDFKNKEKELIFYDSDLESNKLLHDDNIWRY